MIAGIDFSTRAVDVVLLDEDTDAASWHRFELSGQDAFERARDVRRSFRPSSGILFEDCVAIGIEEPMMRGGGMSTAYSLYRVQGAVIACLPPRTLVHPIKPSQWRKTVGLPGNATKQTVSDWTRGHLYLTPGMGGFGYVDWPQDACDAYCIALATRTLLHAQKAA